MQKAGRIVEFFGPSGVGKSTLAAAVRRKLAERGHGFHAAYSKLPYGGLLPRHRQCVLALKSFLLNPVLVGALGLRLFRLIMSEPADQMDRLKKIRFFLIWLSRWAIYVMTVKKFKNTGELWIFERGVNTNLLSMLVRLNTDTIAPLHRTLASAGVLSELVVVVEASANTVQARRRKQGNPEKPWQSDWDSEWAKFVFVRDLDQTASGDGNDRILRIDAEGDGDLEANAELVCEAIRQIVGGSEPVCRSVPSRKEAAMVRVRTLEEPIETVRRRPGGADRELR